METEPYPNFDPAYIKLIEEVAFNQILLLNKNSRIRSNKI